MNIMPTLRIGDIEAQLPIIQGGMGIGVSGINLASAVANEGGIGVLSSAGMGFDAPGYKKEPVETSTKALRDEIKKAREKTNGILGVNIMVATTDFENMVQTAINEKIDIIFAGAGLPLDLPKYLNERTKTKLVPIISSARAGVVIIKRWLKKYNYLPDAFVVEGPMAGGHLGFKIEEINNEQYALEHIVSKVIESIKPYTKEQNQIPVIAAGGIYTGEDIRKFLNLGTAGVQMGTRFVTTKECDASTAFKESYLNCQEEDLTIINSPVGLPGRAIYNDYLQSVDNNIQHPVNCPYHCIHTCNMEKSEYCIALALLNAKKGYMKKGFAFAGQNAYRAEKIIPVHELIENLCEEYETCCLPDNIIQMDNCHIYYQFKQ